MSVTILEALRCAEVNLVSNAGFSIALYIGAEQLKNATILLEKGYSVYDEVEPLLEKYGDAASVPEKNVLNHL